MPKKVFIGLESPVRPSTPPLDKPSTRDSASEPMIVARTFCCEALQTDLEIDGPDEGVGDRRPFLHMRDQRADLVLRDALAFHVDLDAHVGEADRLFADIAGAPH